MLPVSAEHGDGLAALASLIAPGRTLALLGPSGAGKSTLVNALVEAPVMRTQRVRRGDGKGQHTTTYRALVPVPGGGAVLDTPGLRAVGLLDGADGLARTFPDVDEWAAQCRFTDCSHRGRARVRGAGGGGRRGVVVSAVGKLAEATAGTRLPGPT